MSGEEIQTVAPKRRRALFAAVAAVAGLAGAGLAWWRYSPRPVEAGLGDDFWALAFETPEGARLSLQSLRGRPLLINFWATWCPPCRQELPSLSRLKKKLSGEAFEILSVNIGEDVDTVFDFAGNPAYPMLFDHDSKAMASWPVKGVPTTLLVDRQGRLAYRAVGGREFDDADVVGLIRLLLKA